MSYKLLSVEDLLQLKQDKLSEGQLASANSGITQTKVVANENHIANSGIHVTADQKAEWSAKQDAIAAFLKDAVVNGGVLTITKKDGTTVQFQGGSSAWADITGKPQDFTPSAHTHTKSDVTDFGGPYLPTSGGGINGDLKIVGEIEFVAGSGTGKSFTINGEQVATEDQIPSQTSDLMNDSGFMTSNDVVPQGTGTEVIATIGGKQIKAPAGGGGGDTQCLLCMSWVSNYSAQYVTFMRNGVLYKMYPSSNGIDIWKTGYGVLNNFGSPKTLITPVSGTINLNYDGYAGECFVEVDGVQDVTAPSSIDTTGHKFIYVQMYECLHEDTLITMADGTTKRVCELELGDKIRCLNPDTMQLDEDEVTYTDSGTEQTYNKTDTWNFSDGTVLKTIHPHQFYNMRTNKMEYIADFQIGDQVRKEDGSTPSLVSHTTRKGMVYHNTLFTQKYNNYFANGILTGNRKSVKWGWYWIKQNEAANG